MVDSIYLNGPCRLFYISCVSLCICLTRLRRSLLQTFHRDVEGAIDLIRLFEILHSTLSWLPTVIVRVISKIMRPAYDLEAIRLWSVVIQRLITCWSRPNGHCVFEVCVKHGMRSSSEANGPPLGPRDTGGGSALPA